jgi:hypothetical protein
MLKATALADRLSREAEAGGSIDWRGVREEIHQAHDEATTEQERVLCLALHKAIMDAAERTAIEPAKLADFRKTRLQDYNLLLIKEAIIGRSDNNVPPDKLAAITRREVAAGRMLPEDELHNLAAAGDAILTPRPAPPKTGFGARIASWFKYKGAQS